MSITALAPFLPASAEVGDPSATRTVYITVVVLIALGVALAALASWLVRRTRPEPELLAPLEEMETRAWRKQDPAGQRRALDASRPAGAQPARREAAEPAVDAEFAAARPVVSFDDLADGELPGDSLDDDLESDNDMDDVDMDDVDMDDDVIGSEDDTASEDDTGSLELDDFELDDSEVKDSEVSFDVEAADVANTAVAAEGDGDPDADGDAVEVADDLLADGADGADVDQPVEVSSGISDHGHRDDIETSSVDEPDDIREATGDDAEPVSARRRLLRRSRRT